MAIDSDMMRRKQRREKALFLYSRALDRGDFDTVTAILAQAERDAILAQMIAELNEYEAAHLFEQSPNGHIPTQISVPGKAKPPVTSRHPQPRPRFASITLMAALLALILTSVVLMRLPPFAPAAQVQPTSTLPFAAPTSLEATLNADSLTPSPGLSGVWTVPLPGPAVRQRIDLPAAYDQAQLQALILLNVSYAFQQGIDFPVTIIIAQRNHPIQLLQFGGPPLPTDTPTVVP